MTEVIRILGIDPGLRHCGWGVITLDGTRLGFVDCGTISPDPKMEMAARLLALFDGMSSIVERYKPARAAIEDTFVNANPASALKLGHARAAALLAPAHAGLDVASFAPTAVKKAVVGTGRADKTQIAAMIAMLLPGATASKDAADALAIAICAAHHNPRRSLKQKAVS